MRTWKACLVMGADGCRPADKAGLHVEETELRHPPRLSDAVPDQENPEGYAEDE